MTSTSTLSASWIFPPQGSETPSLAPGNFGPVHLGDSMKIEWTSNFLATVIWSCFSAAHNETGIYVVQNGTSPQIYTFDHPANQISSNDLITCHFYYEQSPFINSQTFPFLNTPGSTVNLWELSGAVVLSSSTSSTSTTSTSTASSTSDTSQTSTSTGGSSAAASSSTNTRSNSIAAGQTSKNSAGPTPQQTNHNNGLSPGASAGIGVGVALGVLALIGLGGFLLWRRRKRARLAHAGNTGPGMSEMDGGPSLSGAPAGTGNQPGFFREHAGNPVYEKEVLPAEMPASTHIPPAELP